MPAKRNSRVYQKNGRFYGDFRDYADVGAKQKALVPPGGRGATTDPDVAHQLAAEMVKRLEERRRAKHLTGLENQSTLGAYATTHLEKKLESGKVTVDHLRATEHHLRAALDFFGTDRDLATITTQDVQRWISHLRKGKERTLSDATIRKYLNSLSNLLRRAVSERMDRPSNAYGLGRAQRTRTASRANECFVMRWPFDGR